MKASKQVSPVGIFFKLESSSMQNCVSCQSVPEEMLDQNLCHSCYFSVEPLPNLFQESLFCSPSNTSHTIRCFSQKFLDNLGECLAQLV